MPREETMPIEHLCDDPHIRQLQRLPVGAEALPGRRVHVRGWPSQRCYVEVVLEGGPGHGPDVEPVFRAQRPGGMDGAVLELEAFVRCFFGEDGDDRLLVANLGRDLPTFLNAPPLSFQCSVGQHRETLL
jgi:hypothetical protein